MGRCRARTHTLESVVFGVRETLHVQRRRVGGSVGCQRPGRVDTKRCLSELFPGVLRVVLHAKHAQHATPRTTHRQSKLAINREYVQVRTDEYMKQQRSSNNNAATQQEQQQQRSNAATTSTAAVSSTRASKQAQNGGRNPYLPTCWHSASLQKLHTMIDGWLRCALTMSCMATA